MSYYSMVLFPVSYMWFYRYREAVHFTTLYISYTRDTTNLYTEQKQSRSHMLLRTLNSEIRQHRDS
jgi:hypothetical protein